MQSITDTESWYAFSVKPRHEKRVEILLTSRMFNSFLPLYSTRHKWADRYQTVQLALFPGYVFCRSALNSIPAIIDVPGMVDVVRVGLAPAAVPDDEIDALQQVVRSRLMIEPWPSLVAGQRVFIVDGPLRGLSGSLVEIRNISSLVLSVNLLRRSVLIQIDRDWTVPYKPADKIRDVLVRALPQA
jgi:transcription antitermination factor NusG